MICQAAVATDSGIAAAANIISLAGTAATSRAAPQTEATVDIDTLIRYTCKNRTHTKLINKYTFSSPSHLLDSQTETVGAVEIKQYTHNITSSSSISNRTVYETSVGAKLSAVALVDTKAEEEAHGASEAAAAPASECAVSETSVLATLQQRTSNW